MAEAGQAARLLTHWSTGPPLALACRSLGEGGAEREVVRQRDSESRIMKARLVGALAVLSVGCQEGITSPDAPFALLQPSCLSPAPVSGQSDPRAPGFIVVFDSGVDASAEAPRLASLYEFTPRHLFTHVLQGFSAELTPATLAAIRCETSVDYVSFNGRVTLAN